ncbi:MAG TPA: class I SAM-dependent methyltransferase [Myxococcota bacterium]|nr:class I SAM-dependent methyltransferase [Myxococcota bacterium]
MRDRLAAAASRREVLDLSGTTAWRLFHGVAEGRPNLAVDRYGGGLIAWMQDEVDRAEREAIDELGEVTWVRRGTPLSTLPFEELGMRWPAASLGQDPPLFLDLRAGRRWLQEHARGRVLNAFAYAGGSGLSCVQAETVVNLDHSARYLDFATEVAEHNGRQVECIREDYFAAVRQWGGLKLRGRGARRRWKRRDQRRFDLVVLDPPTFAKSPLGAVDLLRDYPSLLKPALCCLTAGGSVLATNHAAKIDLEDWLGICRRCADKAGRPIRDIEVIVPEADFPSFDGRPPLKIAVFRT